MLTGSRKLESFTVGTLLGSSQRQSVCQLKDQPYNSMSKNGKAFKRKEHGRTQRYGYECNWDQFDIFCL